MADVENPGWGGGGVTPKYAKVDKMLIVLGITNQGFWSYLGC